MASFLLRHRWSDSHLYSSSGMTATLLTASFVMGSKKLMRSCDTWRDWIGTTMLFLLVVKNPPDATIA